MHKQSTPTSRLPSQYPFMHEKSNPHYAFPTHPLATKKSKILPPFCGSTLQISLTCFFFNCPFPLTASFKIASFITKYGFGCSLAFSQSSSSSAVNKCTSETASLVRSRGETPDSGWTTNFCLEAVELGVEVPFVWPLIRTFEGTAEGLPGEPPGVFVLLGPVRRIGSSGATRAAAPEGVSIIGGGFPLLWELAKRSRSKLPIGTAFCALCTLSCSYF